MKRGIILVHGMGNFLKGDFLKDVAPPLARYLESKGGKVTFEPDIAKDFANRGQEPAEVTLRVTHVGGFAEQWVLREAHYDQAFSQPGPGEVIRWGGALLREEAAAIGAIFDNPLNASPEGYCDQRRSVAAQGGNPSGPAGSASSSARSYDGQTRTYYLNQAFFFQSMARLISFLGPISLTVVWLLLLLRGLPALPSFLKQFTWVVRAIDWLRIGVNMLANVIVPFAVDVIGDVKVFLNKPEAADAMRRSVERAMLDFLEDDEIGSIAIVAHSLGSLVSYDALTVGRRLDRYLQAHSSRRCIPGTSTYRRITWVTVGAALNRAHSMTQQDAGQHAQLRFKSPIAETLRDPGGSGAGYQDQPFFWLNIYARYDWVPAGSINEDFFQATKVPCEQYKERLIINVDRPITDHHKYWDNHELVWPRIVRAICDGRYPWPETELKDPDSQRLIEERTVEIARNNLRILGLVGLWLPVMIVLLFILAIAVALVSFVVYALWKLYSMLSSSAFRWLVYPVFSGLRRLFGK